MNLRHAISMLGSEVVHCSKKLRQDEAMEFIRKHDSTPLILNVEGKKVAMNFIASRNMLCRYLGIPTENLAEHLSNIPSNGKIRVKENELRRKEVDLFDLPILKYFRRDGGRYVTAGVVIARLSNADPLNPQSYNASIHRLMLLDSKRFVVRLVAQRHTYLMWRESIERREDLPIAIAIGVHPLFLFTSATRVPEGGEFGYAASLMKGLDLLLIDEMLVPESEIVLIGRITAKTAKEGPFVDITGTYDVVREQPLLEIDAMYMKDDAIYYSITPASSEHQVLMGVPYEPIIYKSVSQACKVKNVVMSPGGRCYFHAVIQIEKKAEGDGKNAILAAFAAHQSLKRVVVVDEDIDVYSSEDVEYAIATRFQPDRDLVLIKNARGSSLDPSAKNGLTAKWGIDATKYLERVKDFERVVNVSNKRRGKAARKQ
jgi:UbiD family decarboxylase